jgi:hypothetical protein
MDGLVIFARLPFVKAHCSSRPLIVLSAYLNDMAVVGIDFVLFLKTDLPCTLGFENF